MYRHGQKQPKPDRRQRGAFLVMAAILIVVIIAVAALALDIGRVLLLRSDMQSAVDHASLAAAAELDGRSGARERAKDAARSLLRHETRFARSHELLGATGLPEEAFSFYCVIGARYDVTPDMPGFSSFCPGEEMSPGKYAAVGDADANYVAIRLDAETADGDRYVADLMFLPVLRLLGAGDTTEVGLAARALAGRSHFFCNYPPMALCDPFEGTGDHFRDRMTEGGHIILSQKGANQWSPGNFGFLQAAGSGPGAGETARHLADEGLTGCQPALFTTEPGAMAMATASGLNTRFDRYGPPSPFNRPDAPSNWPPAPNVSAYPPDRSTDPQDDRFGVGDWDFEAYWAEHHPGTVPPGGWNNLSPPSRWEVYNWEISQNAIPEAGQPTPEHLYTGEYPPPPSVPERRMIHVAVLSCEALGVTGGRRSGVIFEPDGFARIFLTAPAEGPPDGRIHGEYLGWAGEDQKEIQVDIQLYE